MTRTITAPTMTCATCDVVCQRFGTHRNKLRRFRCPQCHKTYTEPHKSMVPGMYITEEKALLALQLLIEGNSIRSTERITNLDRNTIMKLLVLAGEKCEKLMGRLIVNVPVKDVQCDEIWGFVKKKEAHKKKTEENDESMGDAYCFVAIERNTKLVLNFALGRRNQATTDIFIEGLRAATSAQRFQLTADGFIPYVSAVSNTLADRVDFAQLIKVYATSKDDHRYSPGDVVDTEKIPIMGTPDTRRICTSHVERQNLTIRMAVRRLTRLTNAFVKSGRTCGPHTACTLPTTTSAAYTRRFALRLQWNPI